MMQMNVRKAAIATSTVTCAVLLSFAWSEQSGVSLSIESAQARVGRPLTPVSVAGVARRQNRRAAYGYNAAGMAGPMATNYAGIAGAAGTAAVVGTTAAVAATQPWNWGGRPYVGSGALAANAYYGGPIETSPFYLQRAYPANGPWYGVSGWADYKARYGIVCDPGTMVKGADGLMHVCQ
ncbi:hypothetical protein [Bradyrhizobium iriomotense]|uniref:Lectin-like protein BA14k n=1 Tax=Bradyrhizobium iriomotense TaxID=441950 RepID=A0ABQ6BC93_9BRAD|nr:hypothetical protein [Bradyrhizobium iriomotense]GLR92004.1 hypothetical protein GCM10007857_87220 [Bradyrhizobium iriomotense]